MSISNEQPQSTPLHSESLSLQLYIHDEPFLQPNGIKASIYPC